MGDVARGASAADGRPVERGAFASLCRLAAARLRAPAAAIGLCDGDGWRPLASVGLDRGVGGAAAAGAPDLALFADAGGKRVLLVPDARRHARLAAHPLVAGAPGFRFVASLPLATGAGRLVGRLCVLDTRARRVTPAMRRTLADLARLAAALLGQHLLTGRLERETAERRESELALRVTAARLRAAVDSLPFQFWMADQHGRCIMQNHEDERCWGEIVGQRIYEPLADMAQNEEWRRQLALAFAGGTVRFEMRYDRGGEPRDVEEIIAPVRLDGELIGVVGLGIDVTARRRAEAALAEAQRRLEALTAADIVGVVFGEDERITGCNREFLRIVGRPDADPAGLTARVLESPGAGVPYARLRSDLLARGRLGPFEHELARPDGSAVPVLMAAALVERGAPMRWLGLVQDIGEQKQAEARIRELADTDALTRLPNRRSFLRTLERELAGLREGELGAVLLLDLDRFKEINDTLGHDAGDALLQAVARRLSAERRATDVMARLGGDEFAVVLVRLRSPDEVRAAGERILASFADPFRHEGHELSVRASVGASLFPNDGQDAAMLLKNADIALYQAKGQGRGNLMFFDPGLRVELEQKRLVADALRQDLARDAVELVFQPQVALATGEHVGFEALVRWRRDGALLPPSAFLPIAEEAGLALPIGRAVARKALEQTRAWLDQGLEPGRVAINVSPAQLRIGDLAGELAGLLASHGLQPARLEIEITENVLLGDGQDRIAAVLRAIHQQGVSIALDDFGTGYASLAHLKRFPVDRLKIDRSFVRDLGAGSGDAAIVLSIVGLAHALGLEVVAEGIETKPQRDFLAGAGCEVGQGFLFARGLAAPAATAYLRRRRAREREHGQASLVAFPPRGAPRGRLVGPA